MKTQMNVYIDVGAVDALRESAQLNGLSFGNLVQFCIEHTLASRTDAEIKAWGLSQVSTRGRLGGALKISEKFTVEAMKQLLKTGEGAWRFTHKDIARASGQNNKAAYLALRALKLRGVVSGGDSPAEDAWGRPVDSYWTFTKDGQPLKTVAEVESIGL